MKYLWHFFIIRLSSEIRNFWPFTSTDKSKKFGKSLLHWFGVWIIMLFLWQPFLFYVLWVDPWLFWIGTTNVENVESGTPSLYQTLKWIIVVYLLFSCLRAGLTLVEFKGTSENELDKSQRFLKIDWTKRKTVWKKICRKCLSCASGARTKLFRGGGRWLGPFTELGMWLLGLCVGGLCEIRGIGAGQSLPALHSLQPAASLLHYSHGVGVGEGTNK